MGISLRLLVGAALAIGLLTCARPSVLADYPPAIGSVSAAAGSTASAPGSNVNINCTVQDASGAPVAGQPCVFTIVSQPGTDASIGSLTTVRNTDSNGIATAVLHTGSTPGNIVVSIESGGVTSQVTVTVQGAQTSAPQEFPSSGGAPADGGSTPWWPKAGFLMLGMIFVLTGAFTTLRSRGIKA